MISFLYSEPAEGFVQKDCWQPNCWVKVEKPEPEDIRYLIDELHVPESFISDIADTDERPRIENEDDWLMTILRIPCIKEGKTVSYSTVPIGILTNKKVIATVCYFQTEAVRDFLCYTKRKALVIHNKYELIIRLIYSSTVWYLKYLKKINNEITEAEGALAKSIRNEDLLRLMNLQKCLVFFNTSIRGNAIMFTKLQSIFQEDMYHISNDLLEDVDIELKQAHNTVNIYSDILTGTMDAFASVISNNVNTIMKRMTSISILLMVPTLIASFYGMNVPNAWEDKSFAFVMIVMASLAVSALAFFIFKKIKWF